MSSFNFKLVDQEGSLRVMLRGHIDEDIQFDTMDLNGASEVVLDFKDIASINSCGIREWIRWVSGVAEGAKLVFENCPKIIVDQINMVTGFLPTTAVVRSFYVPYYNEDTDEEKMVLFTDGKEFSQGSIDAPEEITDEKSGDVLEIDVIEAKYFKFINSKAS